MHLHRRSTNNFQRYITRYLSSRKFSSRYISSLSMRLLKRPKRPADTPETTKVDDLMLRYHLYARRVRRMLYLGGVLQDHTHPPVQSYFKGFLVILMCFSQSIFVINFSRDHTDNLVLMSKCLGLASSFIAPVLMSCCFLVKRKKLIDLHRTLNHLFERELGRDQETKRIALASLYTFDRPSYVLIIMLATTALLILIPSMLNIIRSFIFQSATATGAFRWPYPAKFLWHVPNSGLPFYLQYLYQAVTCWWMVFTIGGVDSLFGFYAFQISSILSAMSARLAKPRSNEIFSEVLKTCVGTHHRLLRCAHTLENIYGIIILRTILTNAILMCALVYEGSLFTDIKISQACMIVSYMILKVLQTFVYAWYGSLITNASEHFREGIYFSDWPDSDLDLHVRTNVILMMMQKPITITALKVSSVNINMFTNVLNTTISYFFLLRSLDETE